jgi:hypothetical protein
MKERIGTKKNIKYRGRHTQNNERRRERRVDS